jgi:hypothetical protein
MQSVNLTRMEGSYLSVYGTDSQYIGRFVRVRSVRSLKQLNVKCVLNKIFILLG